MTLARRFFLGLFLIACTVSPAPAIDGHIDIKTDLGCISDALPPSPASLTLNVTARLLGASLSGIRGAEYSIGQSANVDWLFVEDFSAIISAGGITVGTGAMASNNPGINIAWPDCQTGSGGEVLLQTIQIIDLTGNFEGTVNRLRVEGHSSPGNPFFRCPLLNLCDDPVFTKVCVGFFVTTEVCPFPPGAVACHNSTSGEFLVNGNCGCDCVSVERTTWSGVKRLYN